MSEGFAADGSPVGRPDLDQITIFMDLPRLGELIAAVAHRLTQIRGIEPPDFDGEEMRELAVAGWQHVCLMADRAEFAASVLGDLENLDKTETRAEAQSLEMLKRTAPESDTI